MFSLNTIEKPTVGFVTFLRSNLQPHFGWHAGCTTNMMRASFSFFLLLFTNLITTQLHVLQFLLFAPNFISLRFSPTF